MSLADTVDSAMEYTPPELAALVAFENRSEADTETHLFTLIAQRELPASSFAEADLGDIEVTAESIASYAMGNWNNLVDGIGSIGRTKRILHYDASGDMPHIPDDGLELGIIREANCGVKTLTELAALLSYTDGRDSSTEVKAAFRRGQLVASDPSTLIDLSTLRPGGERFIALRSSVKVSGEAFLWHANRVGGWSVR